jgi:NAD(P)-dependent dehydrogenase (short-subunit alcohol dehydrogenase family)
MNSEGLRHEGDHRAPDQLPDGAGGLTETTPSHGSRPGPACAPWSRPWPWRPEPPARRSGSGRGSAPGSPETAEKLLWLLRNPEEVAELALYVASDAASYVTGSTFIIDGGLMRQAGSL